jgi:hypothetical protein
VSEPALIERARLRVATWLEEPERHPYAQRADLEHIIRAAATIADDDTEVEPAARALVEALILADFARA